MAEHLLAVNNRPPRLHAGGKTPATTPVSKTPSSTHGRRGDGVASVGRAEVKHVRDRSFAKAGSLRVPTAAARSCCPQSERMSVQRVLML